MMMSESNTPILIVDDHPLFRSALCQVLNDSFQGQLLQAETFQQAQDSLAAHPDVALVLLDLNLPGVTGLSGLMSIRAQFPGTLVAIVSANESPKVVKGALALGACGYIPKSSSVDVLQGALHAILDGDIWVPDDLVDAVQQESDDSMADTARNIAQLTPHQLQVLKHISAGLLNKQIASVMQISESTVKQHVSAVLRKLNVINRTQAGILFKQLVAIDAADPELA